MMKRKKIYLLYLMTIISTFVACVPSTWAKYHPTAFPDTVWATADNKILIEIEEYGDIYSRGYINIGNEIIEAFFSLPKRPDICVKTKEQIETNNGESLEVWKAQTPEKDKFIVKVEKTTYFNIGDVLIFYNLGENTNNDNRISYDKAEQKANDAIPLTNYEPAVWFDRIETINSNDCFVFYACAESWKKVGNNDWSRASVITHWIYIDAVTGEVYEVKATGAKVNATKEDAKDSAKTEKTGDGSLS